MRARILALAFLLTAVPAAAWDQSVLTDARFSPDGRYFSFVEYVEPEAEERGYATMYVIDTARNAWAPQTPLRIVLEGENANGKAALAEVRRKGEALVDRFGLVDAGAPSLPFQPVDRGDPYRRRQAAELPNLGQLVLVERKAHAAHGCTADMSEATDFKLVLSGRDTVTLEDYAGRLPRSRGCADGYDIAAAYMHEAGGRKVLAVLVGIFTRGWEGSDRHLIAVTKILP